MTKFEIRPYSVYELPLSVETQILRPEQVVLRYENKYTVDVGSLCYIRRGDRSKKNYFVHSVDLSSFAPSRVEQVRKLIDYFSLEETTTGRSVRTRASKAQEFVRSFMRWADDNNHSQVLEGGKYARLAFSAYIDYLRGRVAMGDIANNTAVQSQDVVKSVLTEFLEIDDLLRGIDCIRFKSKSASSATSPPDDDAQAKLLALSDSVFSGLSELVLGQHKYPYKLFLPKYLGFPEDFLWVFPTNPWFINPNRDESELTKRLRAYDFLNGRLRQPEELWHLYSWPYKAFEAFSSAKRLIEYSNKDFYARHRIQLGMTALGAFLVLFFANTGMNSTQVFELKWSDDYEVSIQRQGFRVIKSRAAGRICHFEISVEFLPKFKRFLKLRKYLLRDFDTEYLFFSLGPNCNLEPNKIVTSIIPRLMSALNRIDVNLTKISPKEWRAAKSDWLLRKTDPATAALILQNNEQVVMQHYAAGSETSQLEELSSFFSLVSTTVVGQGISVPNSIERAVGLCSDYGQPQALKEDSPVSLDCRAVEGCLFCDKFKIHADEVDTRKLLSCRYCLQQTSHLALSEEHFQNLFGTVFHRIDTLISEIENRVPGLTQRIQAEVDQGELDPYWAAKIELLINLELI